MNKIDEILKIKELLDSGIITEKEFIELKSKIIDLDKNELNPSEIIPNEIRKCPNCNSLINDDEQDCTYCNSDDEKINPDESSQEDNIIKSNPAIKYSGYIIFIISLLIGVYVYYNNSKKESKIENIPLLKSKKEYIKNPIKNIEINNNWNFFYNSKNSFGISGIDVIENNGCIFISTDKNNEGTNANTSRLIKLDSLGNMILNKQLPKDINNISYINKNNYFLITDKTFQLVDSNGIIKLEKDIGIEGNYYYFKIVKLNSSEIAIVGKLNGSGLILKLNLNLEIIKQFTFNNNSTIQSIVSSKNGDLYFSGQKNNNTWFGCLDNDFGIKWENNTDKSGKIGNDIIKDSDNNYVIAGAELSGEKTFLIKIDSMGNLIWRKSYEGSSLKGANGQNLIELNGYCFLITDYSNNNRGGNHYYSRIYKISTNGDVLKESYLKIDGRTILSSNIINYGNDSFLSIGRVDDYEKYDDKYWQIWCISKLNKNIEYGETFKYNYFTTRPATGNSMNKNNVD